MQRIGLLLIVLVLGSFAFSCGQTGPTPETVSCDAHGDTPTAAYKRLYDAVTAKNLEGIKGAMTAGSQEFAQSVSGRNNTPIEKVFENGFTGSTCSPTLPEMRDERINCNMASIEVWNPQNNGWDDLPFMIEDGKWKLAIGEMFKGSFKSPGKGMAQREREAANAANGNSSVTVPSNGTNTNSARPMTNSSNKPSPANKPANQ